MNVIGYYQFHYCSEMDTDIVAVCTKDAWDRLGRPDGCNPESIPDGFFEIGGGSFEYNHDSREEAEAVLKAAGFEAKTLYKD